MLRIELRICANSLSVLGENSLSIQFAMFWFRPVEKLVFTSCSVIIRFFSIKGLILSDNC